MITTNGVKTMNKFLVGAAGNWAGTLAIGLLSTTSTTASTTDLQYEVYRYPITLRSYKPTSASSKIILKASLPPELVGSIYEIGIYPSFSVNDNPYDHIEISDFSESLSGSSQWFTGSSRATFSASSRIGGHGIILGPNQTASISGINPEVYNFIENDYVNLLYYTSSSVSSGSITVRLGDSSSPQNIWTASTTISATGSNNWGVLQMTLNTKPSTFTGISTASVTTTSSSGSIALDHLKFVKNYVKPDELKLAARSESASPFVIKTYGQSVELEYYLQVN